MLAIQSDIITYNTQRAAAFITPGDFLTHPVDGCQGRRCGKLDSVYTMPAHFENGEKCDG